MEADLSIRTAPPLARNPAVNRDGRLELRAVRASEADRDSSGSEARRMTQREVELRPVVRRNDPVEHRRVARRRDHVAGRVVRERAEIGAGNHRSRRGRDYHVPRLQGSGASRLRQGPDDSGDEHEQSQPHQQRATIAPHLNQDATLLPENIIHGGRAEAALAARDYDLRVHWSGSSTGRGNRPSSQSAQVPGRKLAS